MLEGSAWRDRRLIIFTEWEDTRRWLVRCLEEGGQLGVDTERQISVFTGLTSLDERDRIKRISARHLMKAQCEFSSAPMQPERVLTSRRAATIWSISTYPGIRLASSNATDALIASCNRAGQSSCRYFSYRQREEDRVLDALVVTFPRV